MENDFCGWNEEPFEDDAEHLAPVLHGPEVEPVSHILPVELERSEGAHHLLDARDHAPLLDIRSSG